MQNPFSNKKFLIIGFGRSGYSLAKVLKKLNAEVVINEIKDLKNDKKVEELIQQGVTVISGHHPLSLSEQHFDYVVKNPGIPYTNPLIQSFVNKGVNLLTEIEIGYMIQKSFIIGITGSNGKTTTTTLINEFLVQSGISSKTAGNIGNGYIESVFESNKSDTIVTELSSFQLQGTDRFRPNISVLLNIYEAHLDYHGDLQSYIEAKSKLILNQTIEDICVYNEDNLYVSEMVSNTKATKYGFSTKNSNAYSYFDGYTFYVNKEPVVTLDNIRLKGIHNMENILASITVAKCLNVSNESIKTTLQHFIGVEHRLQYVTTIDECQFYNDSKSTNLTAAKTAINSFTEPVILLMGGLDRGVDFSVFANEFNKAKAVVTFGQTNVKIYNASKTSGQLNSFLCHSLQEAVLHANSLKEKGNIVLLSPGCASWDAYKCFEDRGNDFIFCVSELKNEIKI